MVDDNTSRDLRNFNTEVGGVDLGCIGVWHTWCNQQATEDRICERLAIVSADWCLQFPKAGVRSFARFLSDHSPLLLDLFLEQGSLPTLFRFLEAWTKNERS